MSHVAETWWWDSVNSDESYLPFLLPMMLWSTSFLYCQFRPSAPAFHRFYIIHNIHNVGLMTLGTMSLYYDDDDVFNERIPILFTLSYFVVDLLDCMIRRDYTYAYHAMLCIVFVFFAMTDPIVRFTRAASRTAYLEVSNPFMHLAKKTKSHFHSVMFFVVFTCCRVLYIPFIIQRLLKNGMASTHIVVLLYCGLYALQLWWWYKMWRLVIRTFAGKDTGKERDKTK